MEEVKYLPPKFSHSMKDLTSFLGIFEITEEELRKQHGDHSETSSNLSYMTQSKFIGGKPALEIVHEKGSDNSDTDGLSQDEISNGPEIGQVVGQIVKSAVQDYMGVESTSTEAFASQEITKNNVRNMARRTMNTRHALSNEK